MSAKFPPAFTTLLSTARIKHFPKGQIIVYEGDNPNDAFILKEGVVKLHDIDDQGNEKVLHLMKPPAILPLPFDDSARATPWFYTALIDCDMYVISKEELATQMQSDAQLAAWLMQWSGHETHELLLRLSSLGKTNTRDKLLAALRFLALRHAMVRRSGWRRVKFPVNHQLLADMIGVTRESTAINMKELQDSRLVRYPRLTMLEINCDRLLQ